MENKNKQENKPGRIITFTPPPKQPESRRPAANPATTHSLVSNLWFDQAQYLADRWKDMDFE